MPALDLPRNADGTLAAFAWPGGYPIVYVVNDGAVLCPSCASGQNGSEASADADPRSGWRIIAYSIHWEGPAEVCAHCGASIDSAYGDTDGTTPEGEP